MPMLHQISYLSFQIKAKNVNKSCSIVFFSVILFMFGTAEFLIDIVYMLNSRFSFINWNIVAYKQTLNLEFPMIHMICFSNATTMLNAGTSRMNRCPLWYWCAYSIFQVKLWLCCDSVWIIVAPFSKQLKFKFIYDIFAIIDLTVD